MFSWRRQIPPQEDPGEAADRIRAKYHSFRELLTLNNECLEQMAALQEDLRYVPPRGEVFDGRMAEIFEKIHGVVAALEKLTGLRYEALSTALQAQQQASERYVAALGISSAQGFGMAFRDQRRR